MPPLLGPAASCLLKASNATKMWPCGQRKKCSDACISAAADKPGLCAAGDAPVCATSGKVVATPCALKVRGGRAIGGSWCVLEAAAEGPATPCWPAPPSHTASSDLPRRSWPGRPKRLAGCMRNNPPAWRRSHPVPWPAKALAHPPLPALLVPQAAGLKNRFACGTRNNCRLDCSTAAAACPKPGSTVAKPVCAINGVVYASYCAMKAS